MRRESAEVAAAAQRRLELLGRELGLARGEQDEPEVVPVVVVPDVGRHARSGRERFAERVSERISERLPPRVRARFALGPAHLALVALVVAAGLAIAAWSVLRSAPHETPVPVAHTTRPSAQPGSPLPAGTPPATSAANPTGTATPTSTEVVVDVAGKVRHPGVATLPAGSRVVDAIKRAGGARPGVDLSGLNLARKLTDGEQILVGAPAAPAAAGPARGSPSAVGSSADPGAMVNLNTATLDQLDGLPGVGPVTAQKILDWRTAHGTFSSVDELLEVDGIGEKTMADIAPHVTV